MSVGASRRSGTDVRTWPLDLADEDLAIVLQSALTLQLAQVVQRCAVKIGEIRRDRRGFIQRIPTVFKYVHKGI